MKPGLLNMRLSVPALCVAMIAAQASAFVIGDAEGDVDYAVAGQPLVPSDFGAEDLTAVYLDEHPNTISLTWQVRDLAGQPDAPYVGSINYEARFNHRDASFHLFVAREETAGTTGSGAQYSGSLSRVDPNTGVETELDANLTFSEDVSANNITVEMVRDALKDATGAPLAMGRSLTDIWAQTRVREIHVDSEIQASDRAPDTGVWPEGFTISTGPTEDYGLRLESQDPFRWSNGEAATFLFTSTLTNDLDTSVEFQLSDEEAPDTWDVRFPTATGTLEPGESTVIPIAVRTPFAHEHASRKSMWVIASSVDDANITSRLQIGITYAYPPQPAGHHNTLYLHSRAPPSSTINDTAAPLTQRTPFWNTLQDDDRDTGESIGQAILAASLEPGLAMGIAIDSSKAASSLVQVQGGSIDEDGITVEGTVSLFRNGTWSPLFSIGPSQATAVPSGQRVEISAPISVTATAQSFDYEKGAQLVLNLSLDRPPVAGPYKVIESTIAAGSSFTLPLAEYEDPITEEFEAISSVRLSIREGHRLVNPGRAVAIPFTIENLGDVQEKISIQLSGLNSEWAALSQSKVTLVSKESWDGVVGITAPDDAAGGTMADLLLELRSEDGTLLSVGQVVATVETELDLPDESEAFVAEPPTKRSPGVGPSTVMVSMALVALVSERRRARR